MAFCSPKLDQVSANKIIEESIKREERMFKPSTEFTVHSTKKSVFCVGSWGTNPGHSQ